MCCLHPLLVNFEKKTTKSNMSERVGRNQIRIGTNCSIEHVVFQEDGRGHSKSRSSNQKPFHPVPRCFHTHAPRRGRVIYIAASALSGRLNVDWSGMIGRAESEVGAIKPAAADVPRGDLDLGRMLLNVCISVVLESATMRPTEDCFSSEELDSIAFCTIDVTLMGCSGGSLAVNNCCSSWFLVNICHSFWARQVRRM